VLSKTAYPAASLVTLNECNASQDTIATTLSDYGAKNFLPEVLVSYFNCKYGNELLLRQFQGNIQLHLGLEDGRKIPVPRLGQVLQRKIKSCFDTSIEKSEESKLTYAQAEKILLEHLGLINYTPSIRAVNVKSFKEAFIASGRLDAEHYQVSYDELETQLREYTGGFTTIAELTSSVTNGAEIREYHESGTPYLRVGDLKHLDIDADSVVRVNSELADEVIEKVALQSGDVLVSRSGSLAVTAVIESQWTHALISSHLIRLQIADSRIDPYFLALFLSARPGKMQIQKWSNGGVQPEINQPALKSILVPIVPESVQIHIRESILEARKFRQSSQRLLEIAKRAVEIAIENNEDTAMTWIDQELERLGVSLETPHA
jgi:Type I restriction modification DNA specificity domain